MLCLKSSRRREKPLDNIKLKELTMPATKTAILSSSLVHKKINVQGCIVSVYGATDEQFDIYIYDILDKLYTDKTKMIAVRDEAFDYDWGVLDHRIDAMKMLIEINRRRKSNRGIVISLFADEER